MNLDEYRKKRALYKKMARTVKNILLTAIRSSQYKFHLQQIQDRAKDIKSLSKKIKDRKLISTDSLEDKVKDLAGCRIIFYYNDDVNAFLNSGIVSDNFSVDWDASNIHYPEENPKSASEYYVANHYVVTLNKERENLSEYIDLKGLKCEIQIHTILNHAWSETSHNIIYKKPDLGSFAEKRYKAIENKLASLMKDYLIPAGYEFQKIKRDYEYIMTGKDFFDSDIIKKIQESENNNILFNILERYMMYILPNCNDVNEASRDSIKIIKTALLISKQHQYSPIESPIGNLRGKTYHNVLSICMDILVFKYICYVNVGEVFKTILEYYQGIQDKDDQVIIENATNKLVEYDIDLLNHNGLTTQGIIISILQKLNNNDLLQYYKIIIKTCENILIPTAEQVSGTYETFTFSKASLNASDQLVTIRNDAIQILFKIFQTIGSEEKKYDVISSLAKATSTPSSCNYSDELLCIILDNSKSIVDFYKNVIQNENNFILKTIEDKTHHLHIVSKQLISGARWSDSVKVKAESLHQSTTEFHSILKNNTDFYFYKLLCCDFNRFYMEWDESGYNYDQEKKFISNELTNIVNSLDDSNIDVWIGKLITITKQVSSYSHIHSNLKYFLDSLSISKPTYALKILREYNDDVSNYLGFMLKELMNGAEKDNASELVKNWLAEDKHLYSCALLCELYKNIDETILYTVFSKAKSTKNTSILSRVLSAISANFSDRIDLIKGIFLPSMIELTKMRNTDWAFNVWHSRGLDSILTNIDESDLDLVLENLKWANKIEFYVEQILIHIAKRYPNKVINYFGVRFRTKEETEDLNQYETLPYDISELRTSLSFIPEECIDIVTNWYDNDYTKFLFYGAKLLHLIFPEYPVSFQNTVLKLIDNSNKDNIWISLAILRNYNGNPDTYDSYKKIIKKYHADLIIIHEIEASLMCTGVVSGQFGLVEEYEKRKMIIEDWLNDEDKNIVSFAQNFIKSLEKSISFNRRRIKEDIEMQKHQYGTDN